MNITVTVDVNNVLNELFEDFNPEYNSMDIDIKETIKQDIVFQTKKEILKLYSDKVKLEIENQSKALITQAIGDEIKNHVSDFKERGRLKII